jgi:tagatose 6-phosphate kinase
MQGAGAIVISRGSDGLLAVTEEGVWQAAPPERLGGNPTGAEDAAGVALVAGIADGSPRPQRLADTLALPPQPCARRRPPVLNPDAYRRHRGEVVTQVLPETADRPGATSA